MREAGDVCYADVYKDGTGVCEFLRYEDMKYACRKLDDSKFRSHEVFALFNEVYFLVLNDLSVLKGRKTKLKLMRYMYIVLKY